MILKPERLFEFLCNVPYKLKILNVYWDKNKTLKYINKGNPKTIVRLHTCFVFVVLIQILYHFVDTFSKPKISFSNPFLYIMALIVLLPTNLYLRCCHNQATTQCLYINGLLKLAGYTNRPIPVTEKLNIFGSYSLLPAVTIFHLLYLYGLHWFSPCEPSLAGYFLLSQCQSEQSINHALYDIFSGVIKLWVFYINHWAWVVSIYSVPYVIGGIQILCLLKFKDCLYTFKKLHNVGCYKSARHIYRQTQILIGLCNEVQQGIIMPILICGAVSIQSLGLSAIIVLPWRAEKTYLLICCLIFLLNGTIIVLVVLGSMGYIFSKSQKKSICQINLYKANKDNYVYNKKFFRSCMPLKFKYFRVNFVDRLTPLTLTVFANRVTLQLMLIGVRTQKN